MADTIRYVIDVTGDEATLLCEARPEESWPCVDEDAARLVAARHAQKLAGEQGVTITAAIEGPSGTRTIRATDSTVEQIDEENESQARDEFLTPSATPDVIPTPREPTRARRRAEIRPKAKRRSVSDVRARLTGISPLRLVIGLVVLVTLGGIGLVGGWMSTRAPGVTIVRGETMPAAAPQEWQAQSTWRTPALLPEAGRTLVVDADQVAVVTDDRQVALIDAASGDLRWSADYPAGLPKTPLAASVIDGQNVIAAQVGNRLAWWDAATGQVGKGADLPDGTQAGFAGTAPLVVADGGRRAWLIQDGGTAEVSIPEGAKALAGRSDGVAVVAGSNGWWHVRPGQEPGPAGRWEMPGEDRAPQVVTYLGGTLICLLPEPSDASLRQILVSMDRDKDVRFFWVGLGRVAAGDTTWTASPSQQWGILGRTLVNNATSETTDLGGWTTVAVAADRALGDLAGHRVLTLARAPLPLGELVGDEGFPEDITTSGAVMRADVEGSTFVYHLPVR